MALTGEQARRFLAGFEAAAEADREALRRAGPDPQRAWRLSMDAIASARRAAPPSSRLGAARASEDEQARQVWERLRARLLA
jgi:hypothetical protein